MNHEVMDYFGLDKEFDHLGFFETEEHTHLSAELQKIIRTGRLVALSGIVGCGKTTSLQSLKQQLKQGKEIIVSRSLAVDKERVSVGTFITALFYDLSTEENFKLPTQPIGNKLKTNTFCQ